MSAFFLAVFAVVVGGLGVAIVGPLPDKPHEDQYCPGCPCVPMTGEEA